MTSRISKRSLLVAFVAGAIAVLGMGFGGAARAQMPQTIPLTPEIVGNFIQSYPAVVAAADDISQQYGIDTSSDGDNPAAGMQGLMAVGAAQGALNAAVQQYGFSDFQNWIATFSSVVNAYTFATQGGNVNAQMAQAIQQIQNNPNLTAAQKEMMIAQMQQSMGALNAMQPPQANIDAVNPYADELTALFQSS